MTGFSFRKRKFEWNYKRSRLPKHSTRGLALHMLAALLALAVPCHAWRTVSIDDFGAKGDNATDNTDAVRAALAAVEGGGEVIVPKGGVYQTAPFNITSNVVLRVEGHIRGVEDWRKFPTVAKLPSYPYDYDTQSQWTRKHPFVYAVGAENITISGSGVIDGAGAYWWPMFQNKSTDGNVGRPHLMEWNNCSNVELKDVTLLDSAFWTLHPWNSTNLHIHNIQLLSPWCQNYQCANTDGIDVDSSTNVLIEDNYISCGDDHVTILSGCDAEGRAFNRPSKNITVRNNKLGTGMGLSIGSSVSGGVEGVVYENNWMNETAGEWGQGAHIKTRVQFGGYVRNVAWINNTFQTAGTPGGALVIETGYQSKGNCTAETCTDIRDIVFRNLTVVDGGLGYVKCYEARPCQNITFENIRMPAGTWSCENVASGSTKDVSPPGLAEACGF